MIRALWLRYLMHCLKTQQRGLEEELAGLQYMLARNAEAQRQTLAALSMARIGARMRWPART